MLNNKLSTVLFAWALVATTEQEIHMWVNNVWEPVVVPSGTIVNLIAYNGDSPYDPPPKTILMEVPDTAEIGDTGY